MNVICHLNEILEERCITQAELARRAGLTTAAISCIASGKRSGNLVTIIKICNALDVGLSELWEIKEA